MRNLTTMVVTRPVHIHMIARQNSREVVSLLHRIVGGVTLRVVLLEHVRVRVYNNVSIGFLRLLFKGAAEPFQRLDTQCPFAGVKADKEVKELAIRCAGVKPIGRGVEVTPEDRPLVEIEVVVANGTEQSVLARDITLRRDSSRLDETTEVVVGIDEVAQMNGKGTSRVGFVRLDEGFPVVGRGIHVGVGADVDAVVLRNDEMRIAMLLIICHGLVKTLVGTDTGAVEHAGHVVVGIAGCCCKQQQIDN